ncbi:MAG: hypothetical protein V8Q07_07845 [Acutalibacteraceae bacterium]
MDELLGILMLVVPLVIGVAIAFITVLVVDKKEKKIKYKKDNYNYFKNSNYFSINSCLRTGNFYFDDFYFDDVIMSMLYVHRIKKYMCIDNNWVDEVFEIVFDGKYETDKLISLLTINPNIINAKRNRNTKYNTDVEILINDKQVIEKLKKQLEKLKKNHLKFYMQRYELAEKLLNCKDEHESKRLITRYKNDNIVDFYNDADFKFSDFEIKRVAGRIYKFINIEGKSIVDDIYVEYEDEFSFGERMNKLKCFRGTHYFKVPEDKYYRDEWNHRNKIEKIQDGVFAVWHNDISTFSPQRYDDKYNILIGYYVRCDVDFDVNEWLEKQKEELGYDVTKVNKLDE